MLSYTSILKPEYSEVLERLMFFNPGQNSAHAAIVDSLEKFGSPSIYTDNGRLRVKVEKLDEVQTLFALDDERLAGVLVYSRVLPEHLTMIYIAVDQDYSSRGKFSQKMLVIRMFELLRNSARRIKGVKFIRIIRGGNRIQDYSV
ncbi:MAG: hypothetical protein QNL62_19890 [Gammaproteobacteria bacterium]|nr:hypothetical protein [Gammaproteobacteria bacterium]